MKRSLSSRALAALLGLALLAPLSACKSQDAAILLTITGPFRVPSDADGLRIDIYDGNNTTQFIVTHSFTLPTASTVSVSVTLVESGATHADVQIKAYATLGGRIVGQGEIEAGFKSGATVDAAIDLTYN